MERTVNIKRIDVKRIDDLVNQMYDRYDDLSCIPEAYRLGNTALAVMPFEEISEYISDDILAEISKIMEEKYGIEYCLFRRKQPKIHPECKYTKYEYTIWVEKVGDNNPFWGMSLRENE